MSLSSHEADINQFPTYCACCSVVPVEVDYEYCDSCLEEILVQMALLWDTEDNERYLEQLADKHEDLCYSYSAQLYLFA